MAENKKSFLLYVDLIHTVRKLPDDKAGQLLKTILEYVNDLDPVVEDFAVDLVFEPIRHQLKRDLARYESFKQKQSENGKLGGRPKKEENPKNPSLISESQKSLTVTVTDIDTVKEIKELVVEVEEEPESLFEITVESKKIKNLVAYVHQTFPRMEETLKMKVTSGIYLERQEAFILRNNDGSYTTEKDFRNHYSNFILKPPPPEQKEKYSGQKEKPNRVEQITNSHNAVIDDILRTAGINT